MKIVRAAGGVCRKIGWLKGARVGLCLLLDDEMGVDRGALENCRAAWEVASLWHLLTGAEAVGRGSAFVRLRTADLLAIVGIPNDFQ